MFAQMLTGFQKQFFFGLNEVAEPLIRAGFGNPVFWPTGTIVVETTGRTTGRKINIPVLATRLGDLVVFSTVRRNSQWVKNLIANPEVCYWLVGKPHAATAIVLIPDQHTAFDHLPPQAVCLARALQQQSQLFGISFAILTPRS